MARTMTAERFAHVRASILAGDETNGFNADARLILAELDAERAAHEVTKREWSARLGRAHDISSHEITALKTKLALAEAVCESCYQGDGTRNDPDCFSWDALAAWRAAK